MRPYKPFVLFASFILFFLNSVFGQFAIERQDNSNDNIKMLKKLNPSFEMMTPAINQILLESCNEVKPYINNGSRSDEWEIAGPAKISSTDGIFSVSGRVRDINIVNDSLTRIAAASGGLWEVKLNKDGSKTKTLLTAALGTTSSGSVATDPFDSNIILYGTGEQAGKAGIGFYRSKDGGVNWTKVNMPGGDAARYTEIEFSSVKGTVWCTADKGVYISKNSGSVWSQRKGGDFWGLAIDVQNPNIAWVAQYYGSIFKTLNSGSTWTKVDPVLDFARDSIQRIELSNCKSQPNILYACYTNIASLTGGIYKSINGGETWKKCKIFNSENVEIKDIHWGQGWHNSFMSVSPVNPNFAIVGGGFWVYTVDGENFFGSNGAQHPDFHACDWSADGKSFIIGNDGGAYKADFDGKTIFEKDWGKSWDHTYNELPITQFGAIAVSKINPEIIVGGTQDNGIVFYNKNLKKWYAFGGDGGQVTMTPFKEQEMFGNMGLYGGPMSFKSFRKQQSGISIWDEIISGIKPTHSWGRQLDFDRSDNPNLYTTSDNYVYKSEDKGSSWSLVSGGDVEFKEISTIALSGGKNPKLYLTGFTDKNDSSGIYLLDLENFEFYNISKGLPLQGSSGNGYYSYPLVFTSYYSPYENNVYALMSGYNPSSTKKILYQSNNRGKDWKNISGNLPANLPYTTFLVHPFDELTMAIGTDGFGIFITNDGGLNWAKFTDNLPQGVIVTDMDFQLLGNNEINLVIGTYGNGIYKRHLPSNFVSSAIEVHAENEKNIIKSCNYQDNRLAIKFLTFGLHDCRFVVSDINGRLLAQKEIENNSIGLAYESIDFHSFPSGLYILSYYNNGKLLDAKNFIVNQGK